jgi:hypothetical protein
MRYINYKIKPKESNLKKVMYSLISVLAPPLWFLLIVTHKKMKTVKRYNVTICAIFKNEAPYMEEWLDYHILLGIEHFYLYNNFSDDEYREVLSPYIKQGIVTLIDWPIEHGQKSAYRDCYQKYADETNWIGYIDIDEYVCPKYESTIGEWLKKYRLYPGVLICWKIFGTSGRLEHDPRRLIIEQYTKSWPYPVDVGKSFFNTSYNLGYINAHCAYAFVRLFGVKAYIPPVNEYKKFLWFWRHHYPLFSRESVIQINHYWSKSYKNYIEKTHKGSVLSVDSARDRIEKAEEIFRYSELMNISADYTIQRFLIFLKR